MEYNSKITVLYYIEVPCANDYAKVMKPYLTKGQGQELNL